jgi:hypothetical protein
MRSTPSPLILPQRVTVYQSRGASLGAGNQVGVNGIGEKSPCPAGYVSGDASLASLGVTPDAYVYTWGAGTMLTNSRV